MRIGWGPALGRVQDPGQCDRARVTWFTRMCVGSYLVSCLAPCLRARVFPFYARSLRRHATRTLVFLRQEVPVGDGERRRRCAKLRPLHNVSRPFLTKTEDARSVARIAPAPEAPSPHHRKVISVLPVTRTDLRKQLSRI